MKKKILSILLSAFMMFMVLPETVFAAEMVSNIDVSIKTGYGEKPEASYEITPDRLTTDLETISFEYKDSGGATITKTTALIEGDYTVNVTVEVKNSSKSDCSLINADVTVNGSDNGISNLDKTAEKGIAFEINVASMKGKNHSEIENMAQIRMFNLAKECGCKFIFGSDAHNNTAHNSYENANFIANLLELTDKDITDIAKKTLNDI